MIRPDQVKRILVVKPSSLGDILHCFPALALLRQYFPQAELDFLVHPAFAPILDYSPFPVCNKILFERKKLGKIKSLLPEFFKLVRNLRKERYDLIIDFQGLIRSSIFAFLAKGGPLVGFAEPRESISALLYRRKYTVSAGHAVERYVNLVNSLLDTVDFPPTAALPQNPAALASLVEKTGSLPPRMIALIPGARWASKQFPPELFAQTARLVHNQFPDYVFCVIGGKDDVEAEKTIAASLPTGFPLLRAAGKTTLPEMMELLRGCTLAVSNDSGPVHAAAALGKPVIGFFGSTDPEKTGPYGDCHHILQRELPCIKCLKRLCPNPPERFEECKKIDPIQAAAIINDILETQKIPQQHVRNKKIISTKGA